MLGPPWTPPEEPRWLDPEEKAGLARPGQRRWKRLPAALDAQLRRDAGISHFEYQALALLSEAPGHTLRMSELAMWAGSSLPRLSQVIARLEQRGWVRRTPDPADGRYTLATLTDQGQAKVTQAAPGHVQEVRRLVFDPLTKTQSPACARSASASPAPSTPTTPASKTSHSLPPAPPRCPRNIKADRPWTSAQFPRVSVNHQLARNRAASPGTRQVVSGIVIRRHMSAN